MIRLTCVATSDFTIESRYLDFNRIQSMSSRPRTDLAFIHLIQNTCLNAMQIPFLNSEEYNCMDFANIIIMCLRKACLKPTCSQHISIHVYHQNKYDGRNNQHSSQYTENRLPTYRAFITTAWYHVHTHGAISIHQISFEARVTDKYNI